MISAVQVKPGPHVGHLFVERDDDLEGRRLSLSACSACRRLNRAVADLGDAALERPVGHRVDRDLGRLAERHGRDVGLVHFDFGFDAPTCRRSSAAPMPALFIVPTTAVSPSSMLRRVTRPSIGDEMMT